MYWYMWLYIWIYTGTCITNHSAKNISQRYPAGIPHVSGGYPARR